MSKLIDGFKPSKYEQILVFDLGKKYKIQYSQKNDDYITEITLNKKDIKSRPQTNKFADDIMFIIDMEGLR